VRASPLPLLVSALADLVMTEHRCDERFIGYGGNKAACLYELYLSGVSFYVLPDDFLIHQSHAYAEKARKHERRYNRKLYTDFREELCFRYLNLFLDQIESPRAKVSFLEAPRREGTMRWTEADCFAHTEPRQRMQEDQGLQVRLEAALRQLGASVDLELTSLPTVPRQRGSSQQPIAHRHSVPSPYPSRHPRLCPLSLSSFLRPSQRSLAYSADAGPRSKPNESPLSSLVSSVALLDDEHSTFAFPSFATSSVYLIVSPSFSVQRLHNERVGSIVSFV
jgi:hypothetical protein